MNPSNLLSLALGTGCSGLRYLPVNTLHRSHQASDETEIQKRRRGGRPVAAAEAAAREGREGGVLNTWYHAWP